jgi:hypothetical protein
MTRARFGVLAIALSAVSSGLVAVSFTAARSSSATMAGGAPPQPRVFVILELPVPAELQKRATWTSAGGAPSVGLTGQQLVEALRAAAAPLLPTFERDRAPIPIWRVSGPPTGPKTIAPVSYVECGMVAAGTDMSDKDGLRSYFDAPIAYSEPRPIPKGDFDVSVEGRAGLAELPRKGLGVLVGVADSGFHHGVRRKGSCDAPGNPPCFDNAVSFPQGIAGASGSGMGHGAMVAYDVTVAAPDVTLADLILEPGTGRLCDAIQVHERMISEIRGNLFRRYSGLVMVNAWQIFNPNGSGEQEYIANPDHPFNVTVASLEALGADLVFAAGNCGRSSFDPKCTKTGDRTIYGANSHPKVLTVGGSTLAAAPAVADYSSSGSGLLEPKKPDVIGLSDFFASQAMGSNTLDTHTSAAAALAAGIVAAYRSAHPYVEKDAGTHPAALREIFRNATEPCGEPKTWNKDSGWGLFTARCLK